MAATTVEFTYQPEVVLDVAHDLLVSRPVVHNLVLSLLQERVRRPEPGRYWIVACDGRPAGVVFQSPLDFAATMTPLPEDAVDVVVDAMVDAGVALPGINGEAATAARFAGCWTERHRTAARPIDGQRIYELGVPVAPVDVPGRLRQAGTNDRDRILAWMQGFDADTGERTSERRVVAEARIAAGQFSLWEEGEPVSMAAFVASAAGVARIQAVYTPPDLRRNGYASACVAGLSGRLRDSGLQCMLYADLGNPSSNSVYRRIGYRAVAECLRYRFT
ncbi:MAG: uncharacterized protein QOJ19_4305 [Acidimicrobiia bacterium]|nr:uncharacterized protein [Acidimicrobiia bacterium]